MVRVAIVGANGYSGEELCLILARHPRVRIGVVTSRQHAGKLAGSVLPRLRGVAGVAGLSFSEPGIEHLLEDGAEVFFLALPHGLASEFAVPLVGAGRTVIDLSADFRLRDADVYREFYGHEHPAPELLASAVYGNPELHREEIRGAKLIAAPGCYPTSILLPLVPLFRAGLVDPASVAIASASGVTGAGRKPDTPLLFAECNESLRAYGVPQHRHLSEIEQELSLAASRPVRVVFVPHLAPMNRGIHTTIFARPSAGATVEALRSTLANAFANEAFVRFSDDLPDVKNVVGSNFCDIAFRMDPRTGTMVILSAIDNLTKGAAGQAVQCLNLVCGFPENEGLL